jgi:DNA-binding beta-propeller fold protein YncE
LPSGKAGDTVGRMSSLRPELRPVFFFAVSFALLLAARTSSADVGDLTPDGCIQNSGGSGCAAKTPGLGGAISAVVAPGGKHAYLASFDDDTITVFERETDGSLSKQECFQNTGGSACDGTGGTTKALDTPTDIAISPDGDSVYVTTQGSNAVATFARASNGSLTPQGCIEDFSSNQLCEDDGGNAPGLEGASGVAVSPDGDNVYVASFLSDAIAIFDRASNGTLTAQPCIQNTGREGCIVRGGTTTDGLDGAYDVAVSPDGDSVYVVSYTGNTLAIFDRAGDGSLTPAGCIDDDGGLDTCSTQAPGLDGPRSVTVSPDGDQVYVGSFLDDAVVTFTRAGDGGLTFAGCIQNTGGTDCTGTGGTTPGLDGLSSVAVSSDGESLYSAALASDALVAFDRAGNGTLSPRTCVQNTGRTECVNDGGTTTAGLDGAIDAVLSPAGSQVYVSSFTSDALVTIQRESAITATTTTSVTTTSDPGPLPDCGDVNDDGNVTANDALAILRAAVGGDECAGIVCACDVAGGGSIATSDALAALRLAVGQPVTPQCSCA